MDRINALWNVEDALDDFEAGKTTSRGSNAGSGTPCGRARPSSKGNSHTKIVHTVEQH